jgi:hypothetical protein
MVADLPVARVPQSARTPERLRQYKGKSLGMTHSNQELLP